MADRLGVEVPILQGPFGGGSSTPELVAAVSNAGGLGGFGAVGLAPDDILRTIQEPRARTAKPFAINLWVPIAGEDDREIPDAVIARAIARLRPHLRELGVPEPPRPDRFVPAFDAQVDTLLDARPPVFSFVMGIPDPGILRDARTRGIVTVGTATTVDEAVAIADAGVDLVVASGSDAGGRRQSFLRPADVSLTGTMSLVPQIASAVGIPVVAAGGIADGRGIAAALALGADDPGGHRVPVITRVGRPRVAPSSARDGGRSMDAIDACLFGTAGPWNRERVHDALRRPSRRSAAVSGARLADRGAAQGSRAAGRPT